MQTPLGAGAARQPVTLPASLPLPLRAGWTGTAPSSEVSKTEGTINETYEVRPRGSELTVCPTQVI